MYMSIDSDNYIFFSFIIFRTSTDRDENEPFNVQNEQTKRTKFIIPCLIYDFATIAWTI